MSQRRRVISPILLLGLGIALFTVLAYWPGMRAGFYFDDLTNIVENPALHPTSWSIENLTRIAGEARLPTRFVANLSFALNHLVSGLDPLPYHYTNLALHLAVGIVLAWVTYLIAGEGDRRDANREWVLTAAMLATALFLLHPLGVQSVTYVVQRMTLLATLFSLLALGFFLTARAHSRLRPWRYGTSFVFWVLAMGSKEIAIALPLVILIHEVAFHSGPRRRRLHVSLAIVAAVTAAAGLALLVYRPEMLGWNELLVARDYSGYQRVLTQSRVQIFYLALLLWPAPSRLNLDHDFPASVSLWEPWTTGVAGMLWIAAAGAGLYLLRSRPRYGFPVLAYLIFQMLESGPLNLELVFEHRMYLPMTALAVLVGCGLVDCARRIRAPIVLAVALIAISLAWTTHLRNRTWAEPVTFHQDCVSKSPGKHRPHHNLATVLYHEGRYDEAQTEFQAALELEPYHPQTHYMMGELHLALDQTERAVKDYETAIGGAPRHARALFRLAQLHASSDDTDRAARLYENLLSVAPLEMQEERREAERFLAARPAAPSGTAEDWFRQGTSLMLEKRYEQAADAFRQALVLEPDVPVTMVNLAFCLLDLHRADESIPWFERSLQVEPTYHDALYGLALAQERLGHPREAAALWRRYLRGTGFPLGREGT